MQSNEPERVLLAEPNSRYSARLAQRLASQGHRVLAVATGAQVMERLQDFQPTVLIADLELQDGTQGVVDAVRSQAGAAELPILLLGDAEHVDEVAEAVGRGGVTYLLRGARWTNFDRTFEAVRGRRDISAAQREL